MNRRTFLQATAATTLLPALPSIGEASCGWNKVNQNDILPEGSLLGEARFGPSFGWVRNMKVSNNTNYQAYVFEWLPCGVFHTRPLLNEWRGMSFYRSVPVYWLDPKKLSFSSFRQRPEIGSHVMLRIVSCGVLNYRPAEVVGYLKRKIKNIVKGEPYYYLLHYRQASTDGQDSYRHICTRFSADLVAWAPLPPMPYEGTNPIINI